MKLKLLQKLRGALLLSGLCISGTVVQAQVYTFTNAGATGVNGPTQLQVTNAYASTSLAGAVTVTGGIQSWTVPVSGTYKIEAYGANGYGVFGGKGAYMSGEFTLNANDVLQILVGQMGGCCHSTGTNQYGGGGGSFVVATGNNPLVIAGGGGGGASFYSSVNLATAHNPVADASITTSGKTAAGSSNGAGGTAGNGGLVGNTGGGGGGFLTDGGSSTTALAQGGKSFLNGGMGGNSTSAQGGFGGGGGVSGQNNMRAGGGGGYSGGGGCGSSTTVPQIGGGGGSYNSGLNQVNTDALGTGHGMVVITLYGPCPFPPTAGTASATPNGNICGGANIALALTGNSTGQGQTYQWEESLTTGGPFTPIPGATTASTTIQATTSVYYRCAVTCNGFTSNSTEAFVSVGPAAGTASAVSNSVCVNGAASLSLAGYFGDNIQWEYYDNNSLSWLPLIGATTANYTVPSVAASTDYRAAVSCNTPAGSVYSNTLSITVINPSITNVFDGFRCDAGPVTLAAQGSPGTTVKWYDASTAGNLLGTGGAYTTPTIASTTTYYAAAATGGGGSGTVPLPAHGSNYTGANVRGMWFTAPVGFTITGLQALTQLTGSQSIAVVKFAAPPPIFSATTNAFTLLYLTQNNPATGVIPVNIQVNAGDHIGVLSQIGNQTSYATPAGAFTSNIGGMPITIKRIGMQYPLATTSPQDLWEETGGAIGRTEITYTVGCEGTRVPVNANITGVSSGTGLATGGTTTGANQLDGTTVNYNDGCNDKVATVVDAVGGNTLGMTSAIALTSATVQTFSGLPFVPRAFDIAPASSGAATVTLYALQSEFTAYNNYVTSNSLNRPLLPTGPADVTGMSHIVITQFHGNALAGTTGPLGLYDANNTSFITNSNITVAWTGQYWAMTFPVTGFSGFFIHTGATPLVIDLKDISAVNVGSRNRIDWSTADEKKGDVFELERSDDGEHFSKLSRISAKGTASSYSYWDEIPFNGVNYYRLKLVHASASSSYSKVVSATVRGTGTFSVEAYPNPVSGVLSVRVLGSTGSNAIVMITDVTGKVIKTETVTDGKAQINMAGLAQGVYFVKYSDSKQSQTIKVNKQ
jgi:hypothetical protein